MICKRILITKTRDLQSHNRNHFLQA